MSRPFSTDRLLDTTHNSCAEMDRLVLALRLMGSQMMDAADIPAPEPTKADVGGWADGPYWAAHTLEKIIANLRRAAK
ncbi:hypothetical protein [Komagataeibacter europaeus]|uniref:hypothetical protein n=1 Tax=Komagataeibacter europaeus TaxID=33995 RepID=UPI0015FCB5B0|nr:hypothetical protein [Komagataeibacter europaeus]